MAPFRSSFPARRPGVTLLELLVVLVLLGLASATVLPWLRRPTTSTTASATDVIRRAQQVAVRRGQPVRVRLGANGAWSVTGAPDGADLATGQLASGRQPLDLFVDPLGGCVPARSPDARVPVDPATCRLDVPAVTP